MNQKVIYLFFVLFFMTFKLDLSNAQSTTGCTENDIQTRLNTGQSVATVMNSCTALTLNDFYGKTYAGGKIVYLDQSKKGTGILSATADANTNSTWTSIWLGLNYFDALTGSAIGDGMPNTQRFCKSQGGQDNSSICGPSPRPRWQGDGPNLYGFYFAVDYSSQGYTDWYLPSKDELTTAQGNLPSSFSSCGSGGWWSSTQVPQDYTSNQGDNVVSAFAMAPDGSVSAVQKLNGRCIRAFRSFGPWIDSISPNGVEAGETITLNGSNFDATLSNNVIWFPNGHKVSPSSGSASSLSVTVPAGTTSGNLRVVSNGVQSNQIAFVLVPKPTGVPIINSFSRKLVVLGESAAVGGRDLTIYGENFSPINTVTFAGGATATSPRSTTPLQFSVTIPPNALTGPITVSSGSRHSAPSSDTLIVLQYSLPASGLTTHNLNDVTSDTSKNIIIAVGQSGTLLMSENGGLHWNDSASVSPPFYDNTTQKERQQIYDAFQTSLSTANLNTVTHYQIQGTNLFVFWGRFGTSFQSNNYVQAYTNDTGLYNWAGDGTSNEISHLYYVDDDLIAVKGEGHGGQIVKYSGSVSSNSREFNWVNLESNISEIKSFASNSRKVISVGMSGQTTANFSNWASTFPVSDSSWTSNSTGFWLNSAVWGNGLFAGVGREPAAQRNLPSTYYSADGVDWTAATCNGGTCSAPLRAVAYNQDLNMFVSGGHFIQHYYSKDGKQWFTLTLPASYRTTVVNINQIISINNGFILVGNSGYVGMLKILEPEH